MVHSFSGVSKRFFCAQPKVEMYWPEDYECPVKYGRVVVEMLKETLHETVIRTFRVYEVSFVCNI